eukprot:s554_g25.t1
MLGWWQQALRDCKVALRKDPDNVKVLERQGRIFLALDDLDSASSVVADLEHRGPKETFNGSERPALSVRRLRWLTEAARLVERSDAVDNQRRIRPALAYNQRSVELAGGQDADEIEELRLGHTWDCAGLCWIPYAEEAVKVSGELLEDFSEDADARYWRGRALLRLGRHADADRQFQEGLKHGDHQSIKELQETVSHLEELKQRANAFYKDGNLDEAIQLFSAAINRDADCEDTRTVATLYYNRSAAWRRKGEFEKALDDANMALALHPKWTKALYRRGILLLECGRYAEALTELKVVQRADPTFDDDLQDWLRRAHNWLAKPKHTQNFYRFMNLPMDATKEDIKKQYRRLCLQWHPDKSDGGRERFEQLQVAHRFLTDDAQREEYDFGIWTDRPARHHTKKRDKVKDSWNDKNSNEEDAPRSHYNWGDRHLIEDEKVESIYWGEEGCPAWLREKRMEYQRKQFGEDYIVP